MVWTKLAPLLQAGQKLCPTLRRRFTIDLSRQSWCHRESSDASKPSLRGVGRDSVLPSTALSLEPRAGQWVC